MSRRSHPSRRGRQPSLILLVLGSTLLTLGVAAATLASMVSAHLELTTLTTVVGDDAGAIAAYVNAFVRSSDLGPDGIAPERRASLVTSLSTLVDADRITDVELYALDGRPIVSISAPGSSTVLGNATGTPEFAAARGGVAAAALTENRADTAVASHTSAAVLREYLPLNATDGSARGIFVVTRAAEPVLARIDAAQRDVLSIMVLATAVIAAVLVLLFRAAQERIRRQSAALAEASIRDPLTGLLNHGAIVDELRERLERARQGGHAVQIALLDIDGFRLLNETHGDLAGDDVLELVVRVVQAELPTGARLGRYGPDEFLVLLDPGSIDQLRTLIGTVRERLAGESVAFGESERLPVTISAGLCSYPDHAGSVTDLLSVAARLVAEARVGGGNAVRLAEHGGNADTNQFDVLQGLVFAIDTKDRYTKRHSEDVARYALFLAERLGWDEDLLRPLRMAALLHDVGKIGVPDTLLRRPGKITAEEFDIIKQHVALGERIAHELPDIDLVRAGNPPPPRTLGRRRVPGPARRRGHPGHRSGDRGRRRLLGNDHLTALPEGPRRRGRPSTARRRGRVTARGAARSALHRGHGDGRGRADARSARVLALVAAGSRSVNGLRSRAVALAVGAFGAVALAALVARRPGWLVRGFTESCRRCGHVRCRGWVQAQCHGARGASERPRSNRRHADGRGSPMNRPTAPSS